MKKIKFLFPLALFSLLPVAHAEIDPISATSLVNARQTPTDESLQKLMAVMQ